MLIASLLSLLPGARRPHKGPRPGTRTTKGKQSAHRREDLHQVIPDGTGAVLHALPTERSKDMRTVEEIEALLPWVTSLTLYTCLLPIINGPLQAERFAATFPYRPPPSQLPPSQASDVPPQPAHLNTNVANTNLVCTVSRNI